MVINKGKEEREVFMVRRVENRGLVDPGNWVGSVA